MKMSSSLAKTAWRARLLEYASRIVWFLIAAVQWFL
jgi:hypothetical protein